MSTKTSTTELECEFKAGSGVMELIIQPRDTDLGNFSVRRVLPSRQRKQIGPWIFFDHMGPARFAAGSGINVRPHPHINLATVTYLFEGEILHRDSVGSVQTIQPGDINLMVAGRGIVHSERERPEVTARDHSLHGLQLWLALPEADEEMEPAFYHYPDADIPRLDIDGVPVRVLMGNVWGVTSPVRTFAQTLYVEAHLQAGQSLQLPAAQERGLYVAAGELDVQGTPLSQYAMAVLKEDAEVTVTASSESRIALVGGEQLSRRYIEWNFVSSRKQRIEAAKADWRAQRFATIPGDDQEFIPLP